MAGVPPASQRVSAHVVPKLLSDDDEKTTIDPQWDDGSTTREQHKVLQKLRSLGLDEASAAEAKHAVALVPVELPHAAVAKLVVIKGPDRGVAVDIHSGKSFTVGRSLDSDVVLTDIAVSRKHFDLRNEDGWWVISDRGSGNGTLVNGDLRNNPFQLVNGDQIEVGTTVLRFDCPATDVESEVSTISGRRATPPSGAPLEDAFTPLDPAQAPLRPRALSQLADSRIPLMPTRPLSLGPQSPTLLGVEGKHGALVQKAGGDMPAARTGVGHARLPAPLPTHPMQHAAAASTAPASSIRLSARSKYILFGTAAATLFAVVAIAVASSSAPTPVHPAVAPPPPRQRTKFSLPVADLKGPTTSKTPLNATSAAAPAYELAGAKSPATVATSPAASATAPTTIAKTPAPVGPQRTAKPTESETKARVQSQRADDAVDAIVETKSKATKPKTEKKSLSKRTAADADAAESKATALYRAGKFNEAADVLRTFARTSEGATKRSLDGKASSYVSFGKAYIQSMTNNNAVSAFVYLRSATNYDQTLGGAFQDEIAGRMKQIAPKAAVAYIAAEKPKDARIAIDAAERLGAGNDSNVMVVRQKLESAAAKLYADAVQDIQDNPSEAKEKFRQIKEIVDAKSPWYEKATKQLSGS